MLKEDCEFCGFGLYNPVAATLSVTRLGLYSDARFPGRSILMFYDHVEDMAKLSESDLLSFWKDAITVGEAIKRVTGSPRVNFAVLGNAAPHLHVHIIPRYPEAEDSTATRSPWEDLRPREEMSAKDLNSLREQLEAILKK